MSEEVEYNPDAYIPIKATPARARQLMNRKIVDKTNQLNAKHRQMKHPAEFNSMIDAIRSRATIDPNGAVVMGELSSKERLAIKTGDDAMIRKLAMLRAKANMLARERYGRNGNSYSALAERQKIPESEQKRREKKWRDHNE